MTEPPEDFSSYKEATADETKELVGWAPIDKDNIA